MNMSVLSCPAELDQVFLVESHPGCNPIARTRVKVEAGGCYPLLSGGEGHARSIADERGHINPLTLGLGRGGRGLGSKFPPGKGQVLRQLNTNAGTRDGSRR
jgi:hypothetical protein